MIRQTWGSVKQAGGFAFEFRFFIGGGLDDSNQAGVDTEATEHGDIVQQKYQEGYESLVRKTLNMLQWVPENCPSAKYVFKVDDDVFVNSFKLGNFLQRLPPESFDSFLCAWLTAKGQAPIFRNPTSKWFISYEQYPSSQLPDYCQGFGYFVPPSRIPALLEAASGHLEMQVEDVFITGVLAEAVRVPRLRCPKTYFDNGLPNLFVSDWTVALHQTPRLKAGLFMQEALFHPTQMFYGHIVNQKFMRTLWQMAVTVKASCQGVTVASAHHSITVGKDEDEEFEHLYCRELPPLPVGDESLVVSLKSPAAPKTSILT